MRDRIRKIIITLLVVIAMLIGIVPFENRTVEAKDSIPYIWLYTQMAGIHISNDSLDPFSYEAITVSAELSEEGYVRFEKSGSNIYIELFNASLNFESSFGVITSIDIAAHNVQSVSEGWKLEKAKDEETQSYDHAKWSGYSKTVSLVSSNNEEYVAIYNIEEISFAVETVDVEEIKLDKESISLTKDSSDILTATVGPEYADKTVVWSSSNENIATVDDSGNVKGVGYGTATITATATNGTVREDDDISASCTVDVNEWVSIKVKVTWKDYDNAQDTRPLRVWFYFFIDDFCASIPYIYESDGWSWISPNKQSVYRSDGTKKEYRVYEFTNVQFDGMDIYDYYDVQVSEMSSDYTFEIINTLKGYVEPEPLTPTPTPDPAPATPYNIPKTGIE